MDKIKEIKELLDSRFKELTESEERPDTDHRRHFYADTLDLIERIIRREDVLEKDKE